MTWRQHQYKITAEEVARLVELALYGMAPHYPLADVDTVRRTFAANLVSGTMRLTVEDIQLVFETSQHNPPTQEWE